jgi:hypothetical protein
VSAHNEPYILVAGLKVYAYSSNPALGLGFWIV